MFSSVVLALATAGTAVAATVLVLRARRVTPPDDGPGPTLVDDATLRVAGHMRTVRWAGALLALCAVLAAFGASGFLSRAHDGWPMFVALPAATLIVLVIIVLGEATAPIRRDSVMRVATLEPRRRGGYLPGWRVALVRAAFACAAAALVVGLVTASGGREFAYTCDDPATAYVGGSSSPYPGHVYAVPGLIVVVLGYVLAELAMRRIVSRPPASQTVADPEVSVDAQLRETTLRSVCRAATACAAIMLVQTSAAMGVNVWSAAQSLARNGCDQADVSVLAATSAVAGTVAGIVVLLVLLVDITRPAGPHRQAVAERGIGVTDE